jgi:hypothetical protein
MKTTIQALAASALALAWGLAAASQAPLRLRAVNYDLLTAQGALEEARYRELGAALLYLRPDIAMFHNARGGLAGRSALAELSRSLQMYHAFEPWAPGEELGTALLSRYPIRVTHPLSTSAAVGPVPGLRGEVVVTGKLLSVLGVRPGSAAQARAAGEVVAKAVNARPKAQWLVMATFEPGASMEAVKAWGRAGLQDALVASRSKLEPTFPAAQPKDRLDFILISGNLRPGLVSARVPHDARFQRLALHLPVEVTWAY